MNALTKWSPFRTTRWDPTQQMADFERTLERLFNRAPAIAGHGDEPITERLWEPLTDITEDDKEFLVKVELPEMKKEDVKVTVENGVLRMVWILRSLPDDVQQHNMGGAGSAGR